MEDYCNEFKQAIRDENGYRVSSLITPIQPSSTAYRLRRYLASSNSSNIGKDLSRQLVHTSNSPFSHKESSAWVEVLTAFWHAGSEISAAKEGVARPIPTEPTWLAAFGAWKEVTKALLKGYSGGNLPAWTVPCLYVSGNFLIQLAVLADEQLSRATGPALSYGNAYQDDVIDKDTKTVNLEDAARFINRLYSLCISDRAPIEESRRWGTYQMANLLFKTYFKLNSITLSHNIIRSIQASKDDMPPLKAFPKSHQVTFKYYLGVISFLEEDYVKAEAYLREALEMCHQATKKNRELILLYLIPCHLLTTHTLPTADLLRPYPRLEKLFAPLCACIKRANLAEFDAALAAGEAAFVKHRIYLTLERARDVTLRNLFRKVFIAGGYEPLRDGQTEKDRIRRTRVPLVEFVAALKISIGTKESNSVEYDEVECLIANMIYKNLMKGYIARDRAIVVLSKGNTAFPGTGV